MSRDDTGCWGIHVPGVIMEFAFVLNALADIEQACYLLGQAPTGNRRLKQLRVASQGVPQDKTLFVVRLSEIHIGVGLMSSGEARISATREAKEPMRPRSRLD